MHIPTYDRYDMGWDDSAQTAKLQLSLKCLKCLKCRVWRG